MTALSTLLEKASTTRYSLSIPEMTLLLGLSDPQEIAQLHAAAYAVKLRHIGPYVSLRGLIEMGNICSKDCYYCGIRKSNTALTRFSLDSEAILRLTQQIIDLHYGSIVLQSGEIESGKQTAFIESILQKIHILSQGTLGITLSLGEQSFETFQRWRLAGAHRYLLRIESSNPTLYAQLHPTSHNFQRRVQCLRDLRKLRYQVGSGVMCDLPGQTLEDLARDVQWFHELDLDMLGMGPYIPHHQTPLGQHLTLTPTDITRKLTLALNLISVARLYLHDVNIAATTALQALDEMGRERGLLAGANVMMPNVTDIQYRPQYQLYENKPNLDENAETSRTLLEQHLATLGESILWDQQGNSPHYRTDP